MDGSQELLISKAEELIEIDRYTNAAELLAKALANNPEDYRANVLMAITQLHLNRLENAERFANSAIQANPDNEWAHRTRSLIFSAMGRKHDALKSAEEAVRLEPDEPYALHTLANTQLEMQMLKQARQTAERMLEIAPEIDISHFLMGNMYLSEGDNYLAEKAFTEALKINPSSANTRNNLGIAVLRQDEADTKSNSNMADGHFHAALKLDPNNSQAGENIRLTHSYLVPFVPLVAFIPFVMFAFPVTPVGSILTYLMAIYTVITMVYGVCRKRKRLSPELLTFVRSKPIFGSESQLADFVIHTRNLIYKTWKQHLIAFISFSITVIKLTFLSPKDSLSGIISVIALITMIGSFIWLASEMRKW